MAGWMIIVYAQTPQENEKSNQKDQQASTLARWEICTQGTRWLEELVAIGKAEQLRMGGYPSKYSAKALDILPVIENEAFYPPEDSPLYASIDKDGKDCFVRGWIHNIEICSDRINACSEDQELTIHVWDQS